MSLVFRKSNGLTDLISIDYLIIDVIGLQQETSTYRNSSLTCEVNLGGKKVGDLSMARKDHQLQIPVSKKDENLQFNIYPMTNPKARVGKY